MSWSKQSLRFNRFSGPLIFTPLNHEEMEERVKTFHTMCVRWTAIRHTEFLNTHDPPIPSVSLNNLSKWHPKFSVEQDSVPIPLIDFPVRPDSQMATSVSSRGTPALGPIAATTVDLSGYQLRSLMRPGWSTPQRAPGLRAGETITDYGSIHTPRQDASVSSRDRDSTLIRSTPLRHLGQNNKVPDIYRTQTPQRLAMPRDATDSAVRHDDDDDPKTPLTAFLTSTPLTTITTPQSSVSLRKLFLSPAGSRIVSTTPPRTPSRTTPVRSVPTTLVRSVSTTSVRSVPTTPVRSEPTTPVRSVPTTPVRSEPTTPVRNVPTTPVRSVPTTPVRSVPTTPGRSEPTTPVRSVPTTPVRSVPTTPVGTYQSIQSPLTSTPFRSRAMTGSETAGLLGSSQRSLTPGQMRLREKAELVQQRREIEEMIQADLNILREDIVKAQDAICCFDALVQLFLRANRSPLSSLDSIVPKAKDILKTNLPDVTEERIKNGILLVAERTEGIIKVIPSKLKNSAPLILFQGSEQLAIEKSKLVRELQAAIAQNEKEKEKKLEEYFPHRN